MALGDSWNRFDGSRNRKWEGLISGPPGLLLVENEANLITADSPGFLRKLRGRTSQLQALALFQALKTNGVQLAAGLLLPSGPFPTSPSLSLLTDENEENTAGLSAFWWDLNKIEEVWKRFAYPLTCQCDAHYFSQPQTRVRVPPPPPSNGTRTPAVCSLQRCLQERLICPRASE